MGDGETTRFPWQFEEPLCAEIGTDFYYLEDRIDELGAVAPYGYHVAKELCFKCKHRIECLAWGMKNEKHGIWGGLTPRQRHLLSRGELDFPESA